MKINDDDDKSSLLYDNYFVIAIDSTAGVKVTNRRLIRHKCDIKRCYLKIYLSFDIKKKRIIYLYK
jgi:hypothetical protein